MTDSLRSRTFQVLFLAVAASIWLTATALASRLPTLDRPDTLAFGLLADLVIVVPAAYYILVVRPRGWPTITVAPAVVLGLIAADVLLPAEHEGLLRAARLAVIPLELGLLVWLGYHARRRIQQFRTTTADPFDVIRQTIGERFGDGRIARIVTTETAVLLFALASWRLGQPRAHRQHVLTSHERSGHGGVVVALLLILVVEGVAVHLMLDRWSSGMAWIVSLLTLYSALWLVADYRATLLRPLVVDDEGLHIRAGLRWDGRVPHALVARATLQAQEGEGMLALAFLVRPNVWISFVDPVVLQGPYGLNRTATGISLYVDDAQRLLHLLATRRGSDASDGT